MTPRPTVASLVSAVVVLGIAGAIAAACGGSSNDDVPCDPTTDPTCVGSDGGDLDGTSDGSGSDGTGTDGSGSDGIIGDGSPPPDGGPLGTCKPPGAGCAVPTDCCNLDCTAGKTCSTATGCIADKATCTTPGSCCSGNCTAGKCVPLTTTCKTAGNPCGLSGECCSGLCKGGFCALGSSFCIQKGDACARSLDCCSGVCNIPTGASLGACGDPPGGSAFCGGVDGTLCGACTDCCSRVCAPYGPTGVNICQPAEGCHVTGDLCRKNTDCCGYAGSGLPGDGHVTCEIAAGAAVGICRNPMACNPEGAVCHYKSPAVCGTSAARDDCCDGLGAKSGVCRPDKLGVPRCYGGEPCHKTGDTCADSSGCCDGTPCVPDSSGVLRCGAAPCVPKTFACTTDADCCSGLTCVRPLGSVSGTCGTFTPPPPGDAGPDSGGSDGSASDTAPPPICSLYGQSCKTGGDCCDGVPCLNPSGVDCAGTTDCTCRFGIR